MTATAPTRHAPHCPATDEHVERVGTVLVARCRSCGATVTRPAPADPRPLARALARLDDLVALHGRQLRAAL